jgi:ATP-binding cassette subfamily B protein
MIDNVNIKDVEIHLLRKNIGYIPQTPFIIQGTVRENLDPFNEKDET